MTRPLRQSRPNFTQFPNEYLDLAMPKTTGAEWKVLCAIARQTYGYGKDSDALALSRLIALTGLSEPSVKRSIMSLEKSGFIVREKGRSRQNMPRYWLPELGSKVSELPDNPDQNDPTDSDHFDTTDPDQNDPQQNKTLKRKSKEDMRASTDARLASLSDLQARPENYKAPQKLGANPKRLPDAWQDGRLAEVKLKLEHAMTYATGQGILWPGREAKALSTLARGRSPEEVLAILAAWEALPADHFWKRKAPVPSTLLAGAADILRQKKITEKPEGEYARTQREIQERIKANGGRPNWSQRLAAVEEGQAGNNDGGGSTAGQ